MACRQWLVGQFCTKRTTFVIMCHSLMRLIVVHSYWLLQSNQPSLWICNWILFAAVMSWNEGHRWVSVSSKSDPPVHAAHSSRFEYLWQDSENYKRPTKMPAPEYIEHLMAWVQGNIDNESMFPCRIGRFSITHKHMVWT